MEAINFEQLERWQGEHITLKALPYYAPKDQELFRCGLSLFGRYEDLKAYCKKQKEREKTCLCREV